MNRDELVRALVRTTGMPERRAAQIIDQQATSASRDEVKMTTVTLPVVLTLPWSALVSDNDRVTPIATNGKAKLILTDRYKTARLAIQTLVREVTKGAQPVAEPVSLHARVFVPDKRIHDVPDFSKGCHDALARYVFTNDAWIYDSRWTRAGVDVDRPRAEIVISRFINSSALRSEAL